METCEGEVHVGIAEQAVVAPAAAYLYITLYTEL